MMTKKIPIQPIEPIETVFDAKKLPELDACSTAEHMILPAQVLESDSHSLLLSSGGNTQCRQCSAQGGCALGLFGRFAAKERHLLKVPSKLNLPLGAWVWLAIPKNHFVRSVFMIYCFPTLLVLLGAVVGFSVQPFGLEEDFATAVGMLGGLLLGFLSVREWSKRSVQGVGHLTILWPPSTRLDGCS